MGTSNWYADCEITKGKNKKKKQKRTDEQHPTKLYIEARLSYTKSTTTAGTKMAVWVLYVLILHAFQYSIILPIIDRI